MEIREDDMIGREIFKACETAKVAHGVDGAFVNKLMGIFEEFSFPKGQSAMVLKRGDAAEDALVDKVGKAPFDGLFYVRTGLMNELPEMLQDRLCKGFCFFNIRIDVFYCHKPFALGS